MGHRRFYLVALILVTALLGTLLLWKGAREKPANVLLVVVDTLRADRLGCYGWQEETSPNIDALASGGVLFEKMICPVPQTLPSFCTLLTGTYPLTHGVRVNGIFSLPERAVTMAEIFKEGGYQTAAFIAGFPIDSRFGTNQGFDTYFEEMRSERPMQGLKKGEDGTFNWSGHSTPNFENTADIVTDEALRWLADRDDRPFFMMVHYFDPHHDYAPPEKFRAAFPHPYSGEVAFTDDQLGRLISELDRLGLSDDTLVVFTADHGECLGEHGRYFHQGQLSDAALHVPFVLRFPGRLPENRRIQGNCHSVDVMPTILEAVGLPLPTTFEGESLVPAFEKGSTESPPCYFESMYGKLEIKNGLSRQGMTHGAWKFVYNRLEEPGTGRVLQGIELYNLAEDPEELSNVEGKYPEVRSRLHGVLQTFLADHPEAEADPFVPDQGTVNKLKSLGYL